MPKIVDKDAKRRELVTAATVIFSREGFAATRMADVARQAGVGKGTVYEYFDTKWDLFWAVCEGLVPWPDNGDVFIEDPRAGFVALVRAMVDSYEASEGFYGVLLDYWAALTRAQNSAHDSTVQRAPELYVRPRRLVRAVIDAGQKRGVFKATADSATVASLTLAGIEGLRIQRAQDPANVNFEAGIDVLIESLLGYLEA